MERLTRADVKEITQAQQGLCLSLYLPTQRSGPETQQNVIHCKNLLREAEERLLTAGLRQPEVREKVAPITQLLEETPFWQHQSDGLGILLSESFYHYYRVPLHFRPISIVAEYFHLKPLLPLQQNTRHYYLLALSQNELRFFQGTSYSLHEIDLPDAPESLNEALKYDESEKQLQFHRFKEASGTGKEHFGLFHGHGVGHDEDKTNILRYFQQVDQAVRAYLHEEQRPLILAGVEYLLPIYHEANSYPHLLEEGITGNPEHVSQEELHRQVWSVLEPSLQEIRQELHGRYHHEKHTNGKVSNDVKDIVPAAFHGRVETLFVALDVEQWGSFDLNTNTVDIHAERQNIDDDMLNLAAIQTLLHGGNVYADESEQLPEQAQIAAIFRH